MHVQNYTCNTITCYWLLVLFSALCLEYKKDMAEHMRVATEVLEDTIHDVCGSANEILDAKLNEVYSVLDEIGKGKGADFFNLFSSKKFYYCFCKCSKTGRRTQELQESLF